MDRKVFVDTDVIIDHLTDRSPFANHSSLIFELHERKKIQIHISAVSVNNVYYVSRKLIGHKNALALISNFIDDLQILGTTQLEIKQALVSDFKDFEDAIQHATALRERGIEAIITRNLKDFKNAKIAAFSPELYLKNSSSSLGEAHSFF